MRVTTPTPSFYSRKLLRRLVDELKLPIPLGTSVHSCRPGYFQKSAGAWSWYLEHADVRYNGFLSTVGSAYTVRECARASKLALVEDTNEVVPE